MEITIKLRSEDLPDLEETVSKVVAERMKTFLESDFEFTKEQTRRFRNEMAELIECAIDDMSTTDVEEHIDPKVIADQVNKILPNVLPDEEKVKKLLMNRFERIMYNMSGSGEINQHIVKIFKSIISSAFSGTGGSSSRRLDL